MSSRNSEKVFNYLKEGIINKKWAHGERITPEILLSKELGVGRNAVREAIEKLVGLNLLIKMKGKGTFVNLENSDFQFNDFMRETIANSDDYEDILVYRRSFEPANVELFIENASEDDYKKLEESYEKMLEFKDDTDKFSYYDAQFHNVIAKGGRNSIVSKISSILSELMIIHQKSLNVLLGSEAGMKEHKLILDAILNKDKDLAVLFMKRHVERTIKDVQQRSKNEGKI